MPPKETQVILEVAVADIEDAVQAEQSGADRLELNSGLPLGGLTPTTGLLREVIKSVSIPVIVMIRPRPGGFCYSDSQWRIALHDIEDALAMGAAGIAIGTLDEQRAIDQDRLRRARSLTSGRELVFHRAFDLTADWHQSASVLIQCGVDRILTSGQQANVSLGLMCLQAMAESIRSKIELCAGGGVRPENVPSLYHVGIRQFHGTFSQDADDPGYAAGPFRFANNDQIRRFNPTEFLAARRALESL